MPTPVKFLLVVGGATASGKTELALKLAQHFSTVILSADSRQFYREMEIGNARPTADELQAVPHHFVADRSVAEPLSAGAFAREALERLAKEFQEKDYVVLVGGSGLYVRALTEGLDNFPKVTAETRTRVDDLYERQGLAGLQKELQAVDPAYFAEVDQHNPARLRRALEVYYQSGKPYSAFRKAETPTRPFQTIYLQPDWLRADLYERINQRVQHMLARGLEAEVRALRDHRDLPALQTVGYQEWWPYFAGEQTRTRTVELIQQNTRNYAKRQLTWNRRDGYWKLIPQGDLRSALAYIHLVTEARLELRTFVTTQMMLLHPKEASKRVALIERHSNEVTAITDVAVWKNWGMIRFWRNVDRSHAATAVLLHEACYRTEKPEVFMNWEETTDTLHLPSLGWQAVTQREASWPARLQEEFASGKLWVWRRSVQEF